LDTERLDVIETFRIFDDIKKSINTIVIHAKDDGEHKKYETTDHFIRCAVVRLIREENRRLKIKRGRPKNANINPS